MKIFLINRFLFWCLLFLQQAPISAIASCEHAYGKLYQKIQNAYLIAKNGTKKVNNLVKKNPKQALILPYFLTRNKIQYWHQQYSHTVKENGSLYYLMKKKKKPKTFNLSVAMASPVGLVSEFGSLAYQATTGRTPFAFQPRMFLSLPSSIAAAIAATSYLDQHFIEDFTENFVQADVVGARYILEAYHADYIETNSNMIVYNPKKAEMIIEAHLNMLSAWTQSPNQILDRYQLFLDLKIIQTKEEIVALDQIARESLRDAIKLKKQQKQQVISNSNLNAILSQKLVTHPVFQQKSAEEILILRTLFQPIIDKGFFSNLTTEFAKILGVHPDFKPDLQNKALYQKYRNRAILLLAPEDIPSFLAEFEREREQN